MTLVEKDSAAAAVCAENLRALGTSLEKQGYLCELNFEKQDVKSFIAKSRPGFDLVFIDPPYEFSNLAIETLLTELCQVLEKDSTVVVERDSRSELLNLPEGLILESRKNYGDTSVFFLTN